LKKYNKSAMAFYQKYGETMEDTLFATPNTTTVEPAHPQAPLIIDDATEEKARVYRSVLLEATADEQRTRVLEVIKRLKTATDNQIARELKTHPSTISARRNELRDQGLVVPVLNQYGAKLKVRDEITKTPNTVWKAVN
jgi:hypothetical protein